MDFPRFGSWFTRWDLASLCGRRQFVWTNISSLWGQLRSQWRKAPTPICLQWVCCCFQTLILPFFSVLVVCPSFGFGFNKQFLESLNNTDKNFKEGSWIGNYSLDPLDSEIEMIYRNATFDVEKGINKCFVLSKPQRCFK